MPSQTESTTNLIVTTGSIDLARPMTQFHFADGRIVSIPTAQFLQNDLPPVNPDTLSLPLSDEDQSDRMIVPVIEESLEIGKRTITIGTVRLHKTVQEYQTNLDEPLLVRTFDIERVIVNQPVETAPAVRIEGDTTIYPLVEEQLILTKHLVLKEEVRVTRRDTERRDTQTVTLRREHLLVEREQNTG